MTSCAWLCHAVTEDGNNPGSYACWSKLRLTRSTCGWCRTSATRLVRYRNQAIMFYWNYISNTHVQEVTRKDHVSFIWNRLNLNTNEYQCGCYTQDFCLVGKSITKAVDCEHKVSIYAYATLCHNIPSRLWRCWRDGMLALCVAPCARLVGNIDEIDIVSMSEYYCNAGCCRCSTLNATRSNLKDADGVRPGHDLKCCDSIWRCYGVVIVFYVMLREAFSRLSYLAHQGLVEAPNIQL